MVAGDHGESLGEHGERDHGKSVYEEVLRVPFVVRAPGFRPGRIGAVVRLVDLMPTALDLCGVSALPGDGVTLTRLMSGSGPGLDLEAYAESNYTPRSGAAPMRTMRDDRFKVIEGPDPQLFDLAADPFETTNLYRERRALADAMMRRLRTIAGEGSVAAGSTETASEVPADVKARLSALGYAAGK